MRRAVPELDGIDVDDADHPRPIVPITPSPAVLFAEQEKAGKAPKSLGETARGRAESVGRSDGRVLALLGCYRYLSRRQIEEFIFEGSPARPLSKEVLTRRVLDRLKTRDLIAMTPRLIGGPGGGSARVAYFLTSAGHKVAGSLSPGLPTRRPPLRGTFLMGHGLMSAEVALAFRRTARSHRGHQLIDWECDWQTAERLGSSLVVPDAHLVYATAACEIDAFIEVDLGTEGTRFFTRKISRYLDLYRGGSWRQHLPSWPLVLTVTPTAARAAALRRATEALLSSRPDAARIANATEFGFSSLNDLLGPSGPLGEIWQVAGLTGLRGLIPEGYEAAGNPAEEPGACPPPLGVDRARSAATVQNLPGPARRVEGDVPCGDDPYQSKTPPPGG